MTPAKLISQPNATLVRTPAVPASTPSTSNWVGFGIAQLLRLSQTSANSRGPAHGVQDVIAGAVWSRRCARPIAAAFAQRLMIGMPPATAAHSQLTPAASAASAKRRAVVGQHALLAVRHASVAIASRSAACNPVAARQFHHQSISGSSASASRSSHQRSFESRRRGALALAADTAPP